ncbi:MAG: heme ABC transporter ATP-binding protein, partial [Eubacteriales bacterium]
IQHKALAENCLRTMEDFDVRAVTTGAKQPIGGLSGGNQQKFVLGREVLKDPELVVACQPIRGLDIGAIQFIHRTLLDLRAQGKAVLLISAELTELFQLSDRIGVLYKGELMAVDKAEAFDNTSISLLMAGRKEEHHA